MVPWEGAADMYRDFGYHGGIFSFGFATNWWTNHMAHHLRFFAHWLKGIHTGIMREPPVKLLIRKGGHGNYEWREEKEWPLARTRWTKFYLEPRASGGGETEGSLVTEAPKKASSLSYAASAMTKAGVASASW